VPASELTLRLLDGRQATEHAADLEQLAADVYDGLAYSADPYGREFGVRFRTHARQPGFALAEGRSGGYLIGCAMGLPLRLSTSWWRGVTTPLADDVTAEHPGRTFALVDFMVRSAWRRQGIGRSLHDLVLGARTEERATLIVPPAATAAEAALRDWGWQRIARTRTAAAGSPAAGVLVIDMAAVRPRPIRSRDWRE
jgi:GNAT superfamily N-acetyltransferase